MTQTPSSPDSSKVEEFRTFIEREVLSIIQDLFKLGSITKQRIQEIARHTLVLLNPATTIDELYRNAIQLDDQFSELGPVVIKLMREYEERYHGKAVMEVSALIKSGKYDQAEEVVKKVLMFKGV